MGWRFHAIRYHLAQSQKIPHVPRINCLCFRFQRTVSEDRVIDGAASNAQRRGCLHGSEIFLFAETHDLKPAPDITKKKHRLVAADAIRASSAGQRSVDFRKAVSTATGFVIFEPQKEIDAWVMMLMTHIEGSD